MSAAPVGTGGTWCVRDRSPAIGQELGCDPKALPSIPRGGPHPAQLALTQPSWRGPVPCLLPVPTGPLAVRTGLRWARGSRGHRVLRGQRLPNQGTGRGGGRGPLVPGPYPVGGDEWTPSAGSPRGRARVACGPSGYGSSGWASAGQGAQGGAGGGGGWAGAVLLWQQLFPLRSSGRISAFP